MDHWSLHVEELWFPTEPDTLLSTLYYPSPAYYFPDHKMTTFVYPIKLEMGVTLTGFEHNLPPNLFEMDLPKHPTTAKRTNIHITLKGPIPKSERIPKSFFLRAMGTKNNHLIIGSDVKIFIYNTSDWKQPLKCCSCETPFLEEEKKALTKTERRSLPRKMPCPPEHVVCGCYEIHRNCYATTEFRCPICPWVQFDSHPEIDHSTLDFMKEKPKILKRMKLAERKVSAPWVPCAVNKAHQSSCYCAECDAEFCQICFIRKHKKKGMTGHELLRLSEKPYDLPFCSTHPERPAMFYCQDNLCPNFEEYYDEFCFQHHMHTHLHSIKEMITANEKVLNNLRQDLHEATHKILVKWSKVITTKEDLKKESVRRSQRLIRPEDRDELKSFCQAEEALLQRKDEQLCRDLGPLQNVRREIMVALDKKVGLYDVQDLKNRAERALQREAENDENFSHNGEFQLPNVEPEYLAEEVEREEVVEEMKEETVEEEDNEVEVEEDEEEV